MMVEIKIKFILWRLIKKIVISRAREPVSIDEWVDEAICEKVLREPVYKAKDSKDLFDFFLTPDKTKK